MNTRRFGRTGLTVSGLCLGTSNFGRYASPQESFAILDAFRESGGNLIQTSGLCPGATLGDGFLGVPEEVLGRWLRERQVARDRIVIATRIALTRPILGGVDTFGWLIRQCADDSIRRIGCEYLDLLVVEWTDAIAPLAQSVPALEAVVDTAIVRHIVLANFPASLLREALSHARLAPGVIAGVQVDYSMVVRTPFEAGTERVCADHAFGVIARAPMAGGYLASRRLAHGIGALRTRGPADRHAAMASGRLWPILSATARTLNCSPAQVAIGWVLSHPQITSVLVSVRAAGQLRELLGATRLTLSDDDVTRLGSRAVPHEPAAIATVGNPGPIIHLPD